MNSIATGSQKLTQRRARGRGQGRRKSFQAIWQALFVSGLAGGLAWATTLPNWVIRSPEQIEISGNRFLTTPALRALVPLSYPQSLLALSPQDIAEHLESRAPIANAIVTRKLLPPGLSIHVKERQPVAMTQSQGSQYFSSPGEIGLLDEQGIWMPLDSYNTLVPPRHLPTLKVIGLNKQYRQYWPDLYKAVSQIQVKVFEINLQDKANSIIKTSLGDVHLGADTSRFAYQLRVLEQMRELPAHLNASQIAYIDLKNPDYPSIQMRKQPSGRSGTPNAGVE